MYQLLRLTTLVCTCTTLVWTSVTQNVTVMWVGLGIFWISEIASVVDVLLGPILS